MKIKLDSLAEKVYKRLLDSNVAMNSQNIVKEFMKIEKVTPEIAKKIIDPILSKDDRFLRTEDGLWRAKKRIAIERLPLSEVNFIIFYMQETSNLVNKNPNEKNEKNSNSLSDISINVEKRSIYSFLLYRGGFTEWIDSVDKVISSINKYVFIPYDLTSINLFKKVYREKFYLPPDIFTVSIRSLIEALYPDKRLKNWSDLIKEFSIVNVESNLASSKSKTLLYVFEHILDELGKRQIDTLERLFKFINRGKKRVDFSRYAFNRDFLVNIPEFPGVYIFYNKEGRVIYIGKANNLKRRINSYFWDTGESVEKIRGILNDLYRIEFRVLGSELEAIVEEYDLIKKFKPIYNTQINIPERTIETSKRIILLPSAKSNGSGGSNEEMVLLFLCNGLPLLKEEFYCRDPEKIMCKVKAVFDSDGYLFDPRKLLAINYLKRYGDNINIIEMEHYSDANEVLAVLLKYCSEISSLTKEKKSYL